MLMAAPTSLSRTAGSENVTKAPLDNRTLPAPPVARAPIALPSPCVLTHAWGAMVWLLTADSRSRMTRCA
eukprot:COSAG01_NODE_1073_length_11862_cov_11.086117_13_plen_70_part_00